MGAERNLRGVTVRAVVAPTLLASQNLPFPFFPPTVPGRSRFSSPYHSQGQSLDIPVRFGDHKITRFDAGRTNIRITTDRVVAGLTAENEIWGPGIRNALVMSANAPGIPRFYIGNRAAWQTRFGDVYAKGVAGVLTESLFFDDDSRNDFRSLSGLLLQLRTRFDTSLTIGLARTVYAPTGHAFEGAFSHALDVVTHWEYIARANDTLPNGQFKQQSDQLLSVFARWVFPAAGFEVYGEWARMDLPRTATELLVAGHYSSGYTMGFQWAQPRRTHDYLRLQAEVSYLEQSQVFNDRPVLDFYVGRIGQQGYTQRGQVIGAAIGPGGSSQWLALDYIRPRGQGGVFLGRIRWENDAMYREPAPNFFKHDVSVLGGVRAGLRTRYTDFETAATLAYRYNYLFQYGGANPGLFRTVDMHNLTLSLAATPR